jgi:pyruvate dehydrogenase (quinone)/pyruvate oxidase
MDVCVYNNRIMSPAHVENTVEFACRTALAYRGVSHITMPVDRQSQSLKSAARSKRNVPGHVSDLMAESAQVPTEDQLAMATAVLNEGKAVAILAERGALHARDEVIAVADRLGRRSSSCCSARASCRTTIRTPPAAAVFSAPAHRRKCWRTATPC